MRTILLLVLAVTALVASAQEETTTTVTLPSTTTLPMWCSDKVQGHCVTDPTKFGYGFVQSCPPGLTCQPWDEWKCRCR